MSRVAGEQLSSTYAMAGRLGISQPSVVRKLQRHGLRIERIHR
ncbi:hypothetical protein [Halomonas chromatireducens]|nr:hypothetical protein [Halomonas chromatireducens]